MRIQETSIVGQLLTLVNPIGKEIPLRVGEIVEAQVVDLFPSGGLTLKVKDGFLPARTDLELQISDTITLKVLGREKGGEALKLQLIPNTGAPGSAPIRSKTLSGNEAGKVADQVQQTSDQIMKLRRLDSRELPGSELASGPAMDVGKIRELLKDIFKSLPSDIQSLPKDVRLYLQQVLQSTLKGSGQELQQKILQTLDQLPEEINRTLMIQNLKKELLESTEGVPSGRLKKALEDLGTGLESKMKGLIEGNLLKVPEVLPEAIKGAAKGIQQKILLAFDQLPEEIKNLRWIQNLKNDLLVSLEGLHSGPLKQALEGSGVILETRMKNLVDRTLLKVPEVIQGAIKGAVQGLQEKILQTFDQLPKGIPDPQVIQNLKNELLVSLEGLRPGPLKTFLEGPGIIGEAKGNPLVERTLSKVPEVIQGAIKEAVQGLQEKILQTFDQLPEGIADPQVIQNLKNELLVSLEGLQSEPLKRGLENFGVVLEAKMKVLLESTLAQVPEVLSGVLKGSVQELQQKIIQTFDQFLKGIGDPLVIQNLKDALLISIEGLHSGPLKKAIENSGVVLEAKMKALVEGTPLEIRTPLQTNEKIHKDLKTILLQFKEVLQEKLDQNSPTGFIQRLLEGVKQVREDEFSSFQKELRGVESLLKDVETFQLLSKVTDSFYTFLPVHWMELKRGELVFKRRRLTSGEASYSCGIHLELERLGPVSVFIYMQQKDFFVTFKVDHPELESLIRSHQRELEERFRSQGLNLRNIHSLGEAEGVPAPLERIGPEETIVSIRV